MVEHTSPTTLAHSSLDPLGTCCKVEVFCSKMEAKDGSRSILAAVRGWWAEVGRWVMAVRGCSGELWVGRGWEVEVDVDCRAATGGGWALFGVGLGI